MRAVEICAGAGGQALGLELAGFDHELAIELDPTAAATLRANRDWPVAIGDVADPVVWKPADYAAVDLLAGGVPCPPFSLAGQQRGASDERDLFAWAVEVAGVMQPRALLLENVKGLSQTRFAAYREHVLDRLRAFGYWADWRLLHASDYGVPQLRPRFVLVALRPEEVGYFHWPRPRPAHQTVGSTIVDLMGEGGWPYADAWAARASSIAPTIVGGSRRHGGADLGPTRAKRAWKEMGVDAMGLADAPPDPRHRKDFLPRLTVDMVARLQGWYGDDYRWVFTGLKTSRYRQVGNAFPPPVARAVGTAIIQALRHEAPVQTEQTASVSAVHDPVYHLMRERETFVPEAALLPLVGNDPRVLEHRMRHLAMDFNIRTRRVKGITQYRLEGFRGFIGQVDHERHVAFGEERQRIS